MKYWLEIGSFVAATLAASPVLSADSLDRLTFAAFAIKDQPPTIAEAKAVIAGEQSVDALVQSWLSAPEHIERIRRHYRDLYGAAAFEAAVFPNLRVTDQGLYYPGGDEEEATPCDPSEAVQVEAWWAPPGQTISMCPEGVTGMCTPIMYEEDGESWEEPCGCGALQIACATEEHAALARIAVNEEFERRAAYVYENNLTWMDLFAGDFVVANQYLYLAYLNTAFIEAEGGLLGSEAAARTLQGISSTGWERHPFPGAAERSGVVTAPGFMVRFNNFRSRIRALSEGMLCVPIGPELNTDGISTFINTDLGPETTNHAKAECAECHYPMDNAGSLILAWGVEGEFNPETSQAGHVFGQTGDGPSFLMQSFVQRGPGFIDCMAKRVWEDFAGRSWDSLDTTQQKPIVDAANAGPRTLLRTVLTSPMFLELRK